MSFVQRVRRIPFVIIGYVAILIDFAFLGLFVSALAGSASGGALALLGTGWVVALVVAVSSFVCQAAINRSGGYDGASPIGHLVIPVESEERIARYEARYHGSEPSGLVGSFEQVAAVDHRLVA